MNMTSIEEPQNFLQTVDQLILRAVSGGAASFKDILANLPSVYPAVAYSSLERLTKDGKFSKQSLAEIKSELSGELERHCNNTHRIHLPVPHPLDYDWRFSPDAISLLLNRCIDLTKPDEVVVLLGAPTVFQATLETPFPRRVILLDNNPAVIKSFRDAAPRESILCCDILRDELPQLEAAVAIADPPWYPLPLKGFLWAASHACAPGGHILLSLPPSGTRPGIDQELREFFDWAQELGTNLLQILPSELPYVSPPFEINALRSQGINSFPTEWRRGDLAVLSRGPHISTYNPFDEHQPEEIWDELMLQGVRLKIRHQEANIFLNPELRTIVPGDILPSVSRRDERRQLVDVWTSGNRVYSCQGRYVFRHILHALANGRSAALEVSKSLGRSLNYYEDSLIERASAQAHKLIELENNENKSFWEN
jgi:hypothetical protein